MKHTLKKLLSIAALMSVAAVDAASSSCCSSSCDNNSNNVVATCFVPRSQGRDSVIQMVGSVGHTHLYDMESWWGTFAVTPEYTQSFRGNRIARCLFGPFLTNGTASTSNTTGCCDTSCDSSCDNTLLIQGSTVANRNEKALVADNFYLPTDFSSEVKVSPRIRNVLVNLDLYVGLDEWYCGLYFRVFGPITHTRWDLRVCESVIAAGSAIPEGVLTPSMTPVASLNDGFLSYAGGNNLGTIPASGVYPAVILNPLNFGRWSQCERRDTGFADLRFELGWDVWRCEDYHLGLYLEAAAPTGTKKRACYLFDTIIGNDKGELGGGLTGHYTFWRNEQEDCSFGFYFDACVTHLFKGDEERVFDLKGKPLSRYMLAAKMTTNSQNLTGGGILANNQFANEYAPVANLTAQEVRVSVGAQGDVVAMFNWMWCGMSFDFGYNFWGRSCEKISEDCDCPNTALQDGKTWVLKGNSQAYGYAAIADGNPPILVAGQPVPLSASQSQATINGVIANVANAGVDNPQLAQAGGTPVNLVTAVGGATQINTSIQPIFIKASDVDYGARTRGISHKIFGNVSWTWDRECWIPYVGVGAFGEFGKSESKCDKNATTTVSTSNNCSNCIDCALSQWAVWLKLGVSFN